MNTKAVLLLVIAFAATTSASLSIKALGIGRGVTTTGDSAINAIIAKSSGGLEKLLESLQSAFDVLKQNTVSSSSKLRVQYVQNFENIKSQIDQAQEKLIASYKTNHDSIKNNLNNNFQNIENQVKPNFEQGVENFKKTLNQLAGRIPGFANILESKLQELEGKSKQAFETAEASLKALNDDLDKDFNEGVAQLSQ